MSTHATVEALSAYLDRELPADEVRQIEEHLAACAPCRKRLNGMLSVVASLHHLERLAPPSTLGQTVARRVVLDGDRPALLDRLEGGLGTLERQSSLLGLFGLVVALAVIILIFAQAVDEHQKSTIPVIFQDPVTVREGQTPEGREMAGRTFRREGGTWIEDGVEVRPSRVVAFDSPAWEALVIEHPELAELTVLDPPVVIRIGGETLRFEARDGVRESSR